MGGMGWGRVGGWEKSQGLSCGPAAAPEEAGLHEEGRRGRGDPAGGGRGDQLI